MTKRLQPSGRRKSADCATPADFSPRTLAEVVKDYRRRYGRNVRDEEEFFRSRNSLREAVSLAARARTPNDQRHPHQRRIPEEVLRRCERTLLASLPAIRRARRFDDLFRLIEDAIGDIHGAGELLVYDTSTRIGSYLGLTPEAVYLHAGVRQGARALGLSVKDWCIELRSLPKPLDRLDGRSAEDILCIYKASPAFRRHSE